MNCPKCQTRLDVIDSRSIAERGVYPSYIRRRRKCPMCGLRTSSVEIIVGEIGKGNTHEALDNLAAQLCGLDHKKKVAAYKIIGELLGIEN